jgi:hypothetical protein
MNTFLAKDSRWRHWLVVGFLGGLLGLGLALVGDFGMTYDAPQSRKIGMISLRYAAEKLQPTFLTQPAQQKAFEPYDTPLHWFADRDYGVAYELPVTLAERLLQLPDPEAQFGFRHLCTFLVSWVGVLALYGLGKRRYGDWRAGLAVAALLVLSPRLFGEFFYNDKDAVFMALSTVATYTAVRFLEKPTWRWAAGHALACAVAIDVRLMALLWPLATLALLAWRAGHGDYWAARRGRLLGALALYASLLPALVVLLWPYLWEDPWRNFVQAFANMQHFRWENTVLYRGELVNTTALPWHYSIKWLGITTPLLQLGLLVLGLGLVVGQLLRRGWRLYAAGTAEWQDLLFFGLGVGPVVAVIVFESVLYDGWRQMYFIYPSLLLLALRGLVAVVGWLRGRAAWQRVAVAGLLGLGALSSVGQIVWMHPFESLYFSVLAGHEVDRRYEQDYWGLGYSAGLRWVVAHDQRPVIRVCTDSYMWPALQVNYEVLPPAIRFRLTVVGTPAEADYCLLNHRWHAEEYDLPNKVQAIRAGNQRIMTIFEVKH